MASSCLSDSVRRLLDAADAKCEPVSPAVETALEFNVNSDSIEFTEELIKDFLEIESASSERDDDWFYDSIVRIGPLIQHCLRVLQSGVKWEFVEWLSAPKMFDEEFESFKINSSDSTAPMRALLICAPILERSLGNLYLSVSPAGSRVPTLLRDLVNSRRLKIAIGAGNAAVLCILFGSPKSLNLRNVLWHGFASPGEIKPALAATFFSLVFSIGAKLNKTGLIGNVVPRGHFVLDAAPASTFPTLHPTELRPEQSECRNQVSVRKSDQYKLDFMFLMLLNCHPDCRPGAISLRESEVPRVPLPLTPGVRAPAARALRGSQRLPGEVAHRGDCRVLHDPRRDHGRGV